MSAVKICGLFKPKLKPSHPVVHCNNALCIGEIPGHASIIKNPSSWVIELLNFLDGTRTIDELLRTIKTNHPSVKYEDIMYILCKLEEKAFLEEGTNQSELLSSEEIERYHRQALYFSLVDKKCLNGFSYQEKLKSQHVAIFGMGGWGSWIALNLCASGIGSLTLIDGDVIERSNLNRQILFEADDVGKSKVEAASNRLKKINPNVCIKKVNRKIMPDVSEIEEIIKECTFIVIAWTNLSYFKEHTVEGVIHKIASKYSIPIIEIGADPLFVSVGPIFSNNGKGVCFECVKRKVLKNHYSLDPIVRELQDTRLRENRQNLNRVLYSYQSSPSLSIMGGFTADQIIKYATGCEKPMTLSAQFRINLQNFEVTIEKFSSCDGCLCCNNSDES